MYFYLQHLLEAYLHQDYDLVSGSVEGAIKDFAAQEGSSFALGLRADAERFLDEHKTALHASFERTFPGLFYLGDTDEDVRVWLTQLVDRLKDLTKA